VQNIAINMIYILNRNSSPSCMHLLLLLHIPKCHWL